MSKGGAPQSIRPSTHELLSALGEVYSKKNKTDEFKGEESLYKALLPRLRKELFKSSFVLVEPFGLGSTSTVWKVHDCSLDQDRALKLPRPRIAKLVEIILVLEDERKRLAALNHENVIKIYGSGELPVKIKRVTHRFPYYIMEYLKGAKDFDQYLIQRHGSLTGEQLIEYFSDVIRGLLYLHEQGIIHCDIKPGNLFIAPGRPAVVADVGYAKELPTNADEASKTTDVRYTPEYAHPDVTRDRIRSTDSAANIARKKKGDLKPAFDLFALGRSFQEVLCKLRDAEKSDPKKEYGRKSILTSYQWQYLGFLAKRLLDGVVERLDDDELRADVIPELSKAVMAEIRYQSARGVLDDIEKLLHQYDLEGQIPELSPNLASYIQIPHAHVPRTSRVEDVITHPTFARLAQTTQLGFISLVYPGATHTRFEHALGTFALCCQYMRSLWYDQANCLFQVIMSKEDIERGLVAALLHDVGQYPMAHDLTEFGGKFAHEGFLSGLLYRTPDGAEHSLAEVVQAKWGVDAGEVLLIVNANDQSPFKYRLLRSVIDGPLDCDKLDYLRRDSVHLGVSFGLAADPERLLRNLVLVYRDGEIAAPAAAERGRRIAEIGVTEKALVVAQAILKARKEMFTQVYWQHTARTLKAMLGYAVRGVMISLSADENQAEAFWEKFCRFVESPLEFCGRPRPSEKETRPAGDAASEGLVPTEAAVSEDDFDVTEPLPSSSPVSLLHPTDAALLELLWQYSSEAERSILVAIGRRTLYRRLAILSSAHDQDTYKRVYNKFKTYRLENDFKKLEEYRRRCEVAILEKAHEKLREDGSLISRDFQTVEEAFAALDRCEPLVLVDVPLKATLNPKKGGENLSFLPEDNVGVHARKARAFPKFDELQIENDEASFDISVGKIRVLAHPYWVDLLARCLTQDEIWRILVNN